MNKRKDKNAQENKKNYNNKGLIIFKLLPIYICILLFIYPLETAYIKNSNSTLEKCYLSPSDSYINITHLIITRFMVKLKRLPQFSKIINTDNFIKNGIRVMKKYLIPSLENQTCKRFTWILMIGEKANITYIRNSLDFDYSFEIKVLYQKELKEYIRNKTKNSDIFISTRIDYDDRIYYDAVNDVRKAININKPITLYGYNRGLYYYELNNEYYEFYNNYNNQGCMSVFISLILILKKVNGTYTIYDLGTHTRIRNVILKSYKSFGINKLNYEPAIFDNGDIKFIWVRQIYSGQYYYTKRIRNKLNKYKFNLKRFYGE